MSVDLPYKYHRAFSLTPLRFDRDLQRRLGFGPHQSSGLVRPILGCSCACAVENRGHLLGSQCKQAGGAAPEQRNPLGGSVQP